SNAGLAEAVGDRCPGRLRCITMAPRRSLQSPAHLNRGGKVRLEPRDRQAGEPDELARSHDLDRPEPKSTLFEAGLDVVDKGVTFLPCQGLGKVLHDL